MTNINAAKRSATHIRYLVAMKQLADADFGIRSVKLAAELDVSKPSVHAMLRTLADMRLVDKKPHGIAYLTPTGVQLAERYSEYYEAVLAVLTKYITPDCVAPEAVCSLIAGMTEEGLEALWFHIKHGETVKEDKNICR